MLSSKAIAKSTPAGITFWLAAMVVFPSAATAQRYYPPRNYPAQPYRYPAQPYRYPAQPYRYPAQPQPYARTPVRPNTTYPPRSNQPNRYNPSFHRPSNNTIVNRRQPPRNITPVAKTKTQPETKPKPYQLFPRMVAEFEPQRAIMLSVSDLQSHHGQVLQQIVDQSHSHADILILYNNDQQLKSTINLLNKNGSGDYDHVSFYKLELDTVWLRDFGPRISEEKDGIRALDFYYYGVRPFDDSFPERWALTTGGTMTKIPWTIQGGNLISNGKGIGITTSKIFDDNKITFPRSSRNTNTRQFLVDDMKKHCNLKKLYVLQPLRAESTKHVDMFAAFLAEDHVLIAKLDPRLDKTNAAILDANARKMSEVTVGGKPMRVSRISIPKRDGKAWSTYTNAIFTDRLVLVPTMQSDPPNLIKSAVAKYKKLLPNHHVATVDITSMKKLQGSLHCMSLNLPALAPLPTGTISYANAVQIARRTPESRQNQSVGLKQRYTIDKQLRRIFKSSTSEYLVDAYAVNFADDIISLIRAEDKKLIRVRTSAVCEADRYWIQRNAEKIQKNGANVQQHVLSQQVGS